MHNKPYMKEREYACFLREVADQVEALLDHPSYKKTYKQRLRQFKRKMDKADRTLEKYVENAQKNARRRDKEEGPPKKDWVWDKTWLDGSGYWRPPVDEDPVDLRDALGTECLTTIIFLSETQRPMSDGEKLLCDYALLAGIHDMQPAVTGSPVIEGVWDDTPEWAQEVWSDWSEWIQHVEYDYGHGNRTRLLRSLKRVQADLDSVAKRESQGQGEEDSRAHASMPVKECREQMGPPRDNAGTAVRGDTIAGEGERESTKPLTKKAAAVLDLLNTIPPNRGMTGAEILAALDKKDMIFDQSTLTKRIIPELRPYGVRNRRGVGYYIDPSWRRNDATSTPS